MKSTANAIGNFQAEQYRVSIKGKTQAHALEYLPNAEPIQGRFHQVSRDPTPERIQGVTRGRFASNDSADQSMVEWMPLISSLIDGDIGLLADCNDDRVTETGNPVSIEIQPMVGS